MEVLMSAMIPLRTDYDATGARALARKATDPNQVRRLLAIAAGGTAWNAGGGYCGQLVVESGKEIRLTSASKLGSHTGAPQSYKKEAEPHKRPPIMMEEKRRARRLA